MHVARRLVDLHRHIADLKRGGARLAFVPTMGALHAGHLALLAAARAHADVVAASIFVNPLQFDRAQDLARYPRDEAGDLAALAGGGCDLAWLPTPEEMYPPGAATRIDVAGPAERWEATHRPGHFRGVATVCTKLFLQTRADVAMFGEKDWQQLQVVRRVARDLDLPLEIVGVATLREPDGLAMSSRNRFLSPPQRALAPALARTLHEAADAITRGDDTKATLDAGRATLAALGFVVDYLELVELETLAPVPACGPGGARLIAAAQLGDVRLLDNVPVAPTAAGAPQPSKS